MKEFSYESFFANFSNKTRWAIIASLAERDLNVGEIAARTGIEQSNVSHNLKGLVRCNIVGFSREGKRKVYSLNRKTIVPLVELVRRHTSRCGNCRDCRRCVK